jgi:EmrB/QacA subfamily drug resistance transporter
LAVLCVANFMVTVDSAIVILGLPSIQDDLRFSPGDVQWVVSAYLISFGGLLLLGGRSSDLLGRRRMFIVGTVLFMLSSLLCGLAWNATVLVIARVLQGASAALMAPTALSILSTTFDEGPERNKALGIWTANAASGATAALLLGGPLVYGLGWEWIFLINVPIALVLVLLAPALLKESREVGGSRGVDVVGAVTITAAVVAGVYAVAEAPKAGWTSAQTIVLLAVFVVLLGLFVVVEKKSANPLVPLGIFRSRNFDGGNLAMAVTGMFAFGLPFALTAYAQEVLGYSALKYGFATVVFTAMAVVGAMGGQAVISKTGFRTVATIGVLLLSAGSLLLSLVSPEGTYWTDLFFGLFVFGLGLGSGVASSTVAALSSVRPEEMGLASGINTAAFQIGGAIGVAIVSTVVVTSTTGTSPEALTDGLSAGFLTCVAFGVVGLLVTLFVMRTPKPAVAGAEAPTPAAS